MSLRLEMLQVARLAPKVLGPEAAALVEQFVRHQQLPAGGFPDRSGSPDLYYSSFAADTLTALQAELPQNLGRYLDAALENPPADFVHLACLARLRSIFPSLRANAGDLAPIEAFRTPDGGYNQRAHAGAGSAYACLLAFGAYADHGLDVPDPDGILTCLSSLRCPDGGFANEVTLPIGGSPPTAAAVTLLRNLQHPVPDETGAFLLSCFHESGGVMAFAEAPMPDLLSTAVTLHALDGLQVPFHNLRDLTLDFVDTLWNAEGGFHGNWADDTLDIEYSYYGLLALGHLAL